MVPNSSLKLIFTGDLCCNRRFSQHLQAGKELLSPSLQAKFEAADYVIYNYEGISLDPAYSPALGISVFNHQGIGEYLHQKSNAIFNLANNHTFDWGSRGLAETIHPMQQKGWSYFGAGHTIEEASRPVTLIKNDTSVNIFGMLAYTQQGNFGRGNGICDQNSRKLLKKQMAASDALNILCVHGGEEFTFFPMPYKRRYLRKLAYELKPAVLICHHAHTFQGVEKLGDTLIFYSLGNFMFDYPSHRLYDETGTGCLAELEIRDHQVYYQLSGVSVDAERGAVGTGRIEEVSAFEERLYLKNYKKNIGPDACRVVFDSKKRRSLVPNEDNKPITRKKQWLHRLNMLMDILGDRFMFSVYWQAFLSKLTHPKTRRHG